jgi:hypothetical protein
MQHSDNEYDRAYREKFRGVRPIIEKHFVGFEQKIIMDMTHRFIAGEEFELFESWNFKEQQKNLTKLRAQFQKAKISLEGIHLGVLQEIYDNLTLPIEVLNGTKDRKTCAEEVFDLAPSREEVAAAASVLKGLLAFSENIDKAIKYTQDELPFGIPVGNRNIKGWRVVEAAVELNRTYDCPIFIPKKIDGSGPMRELLVDLFEHYKITGTVDAAFNGWLEHIDRKREFLELLPID